MNALMQMLIQQLSGDAVNKIAKQLGIDTSTASRAVGMAIPVLISALTRNSSTEEGAASLHNALVKDHDGSIFENLGDLISNVAGSSGAGILKHILGADQPTVTSRIGQSAGLDTGTMGQIMEMVAPLVMGALGKTTRDEGLDSSGLSALLTGQQQEAEAEQPDLFGSLNRMLDSDGDGSSMDEIGGILGKLFS
ncbi:MAG TPA: DUF937 domain-containing protein [bacterium]|nr:DUF937 domain-containing protein [bacterium]HQG44641.1 DUF937 domain-containing protein [bacterium]HQI47408.1 DUF937 domain-containing protein [bacterium]HQJ63822.1 DUF937 domain-containing protein [bacterium]